jgi:glutamyl-tRNA synthetase
MELFNIHIETVKEAQVSSRLHSEAYEEARRLRSPLIHWLPSVGGIPFDVVMPNGSGVKGLAEETFRKVSVDHVVQFVRFGFVRVDRVDEKVVVFFAHK